MDNYQDKPILLRHLIGQSAGFMPNAYDNLIEANYKRPRVLRELGKLNSICKPGYCYTYQNALFSLQVQEKNVITNELNFDRTNERYKLGQVTSIDFRQAQVNLINAELSVSNAKYTAKNAELQLLQLAGSLLDNKNF